MSVVETATGWRIDLGMPNTSRLRRGTRLPSARMASDRMLDPQFYEADQSLIDAIHAAVLLGQPLLIAGEPGCGKTEVANFVAYQFGLEPPQPPGDRKEYALRFDTKSTTTARDLFYSFDVVGRFHASRSDDTTSTDPRRFIRFHALGRAVLDAAPAAQVKGITGINYSRAAVEPRRSVVLIDEIDKAPRDVPNDLLMEVDRLAFYITELDRTVTADPAFRPILVITSNSERVLPDAFLRRCVFYSMQFPDDERLRRIVDNRVTKFPFGSGMLKDALKLFQSLRDLQLQKHPGTAELLGFLHTLLGHGLDPAAALDADGRGWEELAKATLLKTRDDQEQFKEAGDLAALIRQSDLP
jgi:MoxR-like ATPase